MQFPKSTEYASYYQTYVQHLPQRDPLLLLEQTWTYAEAILDKVRPEQYDYAYAPGKWTIKQLLSHIVDTEHILSYRALRFARGDRQSALPFDQDLYVGATATEDLDWHQLVQGWRHLRGYTQIQFAQYGPAIAGREGSEVFPCTVRAVAAIVAAHGLHHLKVLQERYWGTAPLELDAVLEAT